MAFPGYDVGFAIDTGPDAIFSDYASQGGNIDTFIEFDLGQPYTLSEIIFTDRVTSGGPNHAWFGGLFDFVFAFNYILSVDDDFTNGDGISDDIVFEVEAVEPDGDVPDESEIELLQTSATIPDVLAQYVRWEITDTLGQNPGASNFEFIASSGGGPPGDFNNNGDLDDNDLDLLAEQQQMTTPDLSFDLNDDDLVNFADRQVWVDDLKNTWIGDANLDGEFNSGDMVQVFVRGKYEKDELAGWEEGDWDGDQRFSSGDMVAAFVAGGYEKGNRPPAVGAVPEPGGLPALLLGSVVALNWRCRRVLVSEGRRR